MYFLSVSLSSLGQRRDVVWGSDNTEDCYCGREADCSLQTSWGEAAAAYQTHDFMLNKRIG